jgi:hypothetical protein
LPCALQIEKAFEIMLEYNHHEYLMYHHRYFSFISVAKASDFFAAMKINADFYFCVFHYSQKTLIVSVREGGRIERKRKTRN